MRFLAQLVVRELLGNPAVKSAIFVELKAIAAKTDTKFDDEALAVAEEIWGGLVAALIGKR